STPTTTLIVALVAAIVGIQVLSFLLNTAGAGRSASGGPALVVAPNWSRRGFLIQAGAIAVASTAAGVLARRLLTAGTDSAPTTSAGQPVVLPAPTQVATLPAGASLDQPGITPIVVPNDQFYRIDTALIPPSVDANAWTLRIHGMVDHEVTLRYADL